MMDHSDSDHNACSFWSAYRSIAAFMDVMCSDPDLEEYGLAVNLVVDSDSDGSDDSDDSDSSVSDSDEEEEEEENYVVPDYELVAQEKPAVWDFNDNDVMGDR
jgi:hypothetical protein